MSESTFAHDQRRVLLRIARDSIAFGLHHGRALGVAPEDYEGALRETCASFVTLRRRGDLRGCIGQLEATMALVCGVARNAHAAAFRDPRFSPLLAHELSGLEVSVSVLSPPRVVTARDDADLLAQLRPGEDGLILRDGDKVATFLPAVWETLPLAADFVAQLKRKAGLDPAHWSPTLEIRRYRSETFGDGGDSPA